MNIQYHFLVLVLSVVLERSDLGFYNTIEITARDRKNIELGVNIGAGTSIFDRANGGLARNNRQKRLDKQILNAPKRVFLTKLGLSTFPGLEIVDKARNNCAHAKLRADWHAILAVKLATR